MNPDILYGRRPVWEALKADQRPIYKLWLARGSAGALLQEIIQEARNRRIPFQWVPKHQLSQKAPGNHQGVVAQIAAAAYQDLEEVLKGKDLAQVVLLALDGVQDPQNLGAIIRNAVSFNVTAVLVPKWRGVGLTSSVARASSGALEHIPMVQVTNMAQSLLDLKRRQFWVYGADMKGQNCREVDFHRPLLMVLGQEGSGLHRLVRERCDLLVRIPQSSAVAALNVSSASAILLYELSRKTR